MHAIQKAIADFFDLLGFNANVDRYDPRLGRILGKERARKARGWCGEYRGSDGKLHTGHCPRDVNGVRKIFEQLIVRAEPSLRPEFERRLAEICEMIQVHPTSSPITILAPSNVDGIVQALTAPMRRHADVRLDVVTRCGTQHKTCEVCMGPMVTQVATTARAGTRIAVRIIELGARISVQPDTAEWPGHLTAQVCPAGPSERLSWHGSLVSAHERELSEKQDDFNRLWERLTVGNTPRRWGLELVS